MTATASDGVTTFRGGAAAVELTPTRPCFLYGYPDVARTSTGVLDPLLASALYLADASSGVLFIACDLIWLSRDLVQQARQRIAQATGLAPGSIMISASHTHSGPVTTRVVSNGADPLVPPPDEAYLAQVVDAIVSAGEQAQSATRPLRVKFAVADGSMLGTNRRDPQGPSLPQVPVLWCEDAEHGTAIGVMAICAMHPTVLHGDSTLISGDFPGQARQYLQEHVIGPDCPFIYHMGASGNQSPRHVVEDHTPAAARRLGEALGRSIADAASRAETIGQVAISVQRSSLDLPLRTMPSVATASESLHRATAHYRSLIESGAPRTALRTAECDCFGAKETLTLAQAAERGELAAAAATCLPAEVQVIRIGPYAFVGWPGEIFVEFALSVRERYPHAWIITLAGGDLQVYLVTQQAIDEQAYEAGNALFESPTSGELLVATTCRLLQDPA